MYTEPNQLSKSEMLNFLNKRLDTLTALGNFVEGTVFNEMKKMQEAFDITLKNLRMVQEEYRRFIHKVSRINKIPCVGATKIQDILRYPSDVSMQAFENIFLEETPHGNQIRGDLYSLSCRLNLLSFDLSIKMFNELGEDSEISIERENENKAHFYELKNIIDVFRGNFKKKIQTYDINKSAPQVSEVHNASDVQPLRKTYKEDLKAVLARTSQTTSNYSSSGSTASSIPSSGNSSEAQSTISDATTESAYSPYTTLSASPYSTISEHK
mmetsp:Transcript_31536/g.31261  ORF Transcript_31536/g.31261 Transcript_31536/m.31261 type:complete len:269 (-) Transcript_31536:29-835(-)